MTPYHLNLDGVEPASTGDFTVLPNGWYDVRIIEAKETVSAVKGTPGCELRFRVIDGPHLGSTFKDTLWISANPAALSFLRQRLESMGYPIPRGEFYLNPQDLIGRIVSVQTEQRQGDKATFMDVKAYDKPAGPDMPSHPGADQPPSPDWRAEAPAAPAAPSELQPAPVAGQQAGQSAETEQFPFSPSKA